VTAAVVAVGRELERMGHHVELTVPDFDVEGFFDAMRPVWTSGLAVTAYGLGREMGREPSAENLEAVTWAGVQEGVDVTALQLAPSHAAQNALARKWGRFLDDFDLHVCPTLAQPPLALGALDQDSRDRTFEDWARELMAFAPFTQLYNNTGQPAISLPLGMTRDGLPIGVMFGAQALREDLLLQVAARLEEAMPWAQRAPAVQVGAATAAFGS
jgi:amidase